MRRLRPPGLESLFVAAPVLFGFRLGAKPIGDNSTFVHLRTGHDIVAGLGIPRRDPYSFTAHGHRWVDQSWLPEWTYGWMNRISGYHALVFEQAVLMTVLAWAIARLARTGSALRTGLAASVAVGIGAGYWTPRPLLFGLLALAATVTVVERRRSPWLLVPVVWVWVNSHGSFPLGLAWLVAYAAGEWLDDRARPVHTLRCIGTFVVGLAVSSLNPLGPRLLAFPFVVEAKREVFKTIVEWRSPDFQSTEGTFALLFLLLAVVILSRRRVPWRDALPFVGFLAFGLLAFRNVPALGVIAAPALGRALRVEGQPAVPAGDADRPRINAMFAAAFVVAYVVFSAVVLGRDGLNVKTYPVAAVDYIEAQGLRGDGHRLASQDVVGCYLDLRYGRKANVFIDDRFDMFPASVSDDYEHLLHGDDRALEVLDRQRVDVVLWDRHLPLVTLLQQTRQWREIFRKDGWTVLQRA